MLQYDGVVHRYPSGRVALNNVRLEVAAGERVALVGPSGSGKTTLFRLTYGAFAPTQGRVIVGGIDVAAVNGAALRTLRSRIAVIFQAHGLVDNLAVWRNVAAGYFGKRTTWGALRTVMAPDPEERQQIRDALGRVGLADRYHDRAFALSGGQRQRVAIARAILQQADIVLADEPAASLDPSLGGEVIEELLADAKARGTTLLCSLHQDHLALRFDRLVRLEHGAVTYDGDPREALKPKAIPLTSAR